MATVPALGSPSIGADTNPTPRINVQAPADAFGASVVGAGLQEVGAALGHSAEEMNAFATQYQALNNKQAADSASISFITSADKAHSAYIEANKGSMSAVENLPDYYKGLETARTDAAKDLSPMAKVDYDSATRRYAAGLQGQAVTYAQAQRTDSITNTAKASTQLALGKMANAEIGDEDWKWGLQTIGSNTATLAQLNRWDDIQSRAYVQSQLSNAYLGQIATANASGNIPKANAILAAHADEMTEPQINQARAALKAGEQSYVVNQIRLTAANGGGTATVPGLSASSVNNNPTNLKTPPGDRWAGQTGEDSRGIAQFDTEDHAIDAAVKNLSAYGAKHGIDTLNSIAARWAPKGDGANDPVAYGAALGKSLNIDPNAKLDMTNQYLLHRIVQAQIPLETKGPSASAAPAMSVPNLATPPSTTNMETWQAGKIAEVDHFINTSFQSNPTQGERVRSGLLAQIQQTGQLVGAQQKGTRDDIWTFIDANHINDVGALNAARPGTDNQLAALPPQMQHQIQSAMNFNANQVTPERMQNTQAVEGLKALNPEQFLKIDPMASDLTRADQIRFAKEQAQLKGKVAHQQSDPALRSAMNSIEVKNALNGLKLDPLSTDEGTVKKYYEFAGALKAEIDAASTPGKPVKPDQIGAMVQNITFQKGKDWSGKPSGPANYEVPDADYRAIHDLYIKHGQNPTSYDIGDYYRSHNRGK